MKQKKLSIVVVILVIVIGIIYLIYNNSNNGGDVSNVERTITTSKVYSEEDINDAMDIVLKSFKSDFKGCTLTDLWYNENICISVADEWSAQYGADESIVLISNFDVDSSGGDGSLNPNATYTDWQWILVRNKGSVWELKTWGY